MTAIFIFKTMLNVIVDQLTLGLTNGALDRVKLLSQIDTSTPFTEHGQDSREVPLCLFETGNDLRVRCVFHNSVTYPGGEDIIKYADAVHRDVRG